MIGEAIGRLALQLKERRRRKALLRTQFDGVCPECGGSMDFLKAKTEYREGGAYCPGFLFVCHGCMGVLWEPNRALFKTSTYKKL